MNTAEEREEQRRLDRLAMRYLAALDAGDIDSLDELWERAGTDPALLAMLNELNAELVREQDSQEPNH